MNDEDYEKFCTSKWRNGMCAYEYFPGSSDIIASALGLGGEAGEVQELVKKFEVHGKEFDLERLTEELGDVEYYLARLRTLYGIAREDVIEANVCKLNERYPERK